MAHIVVLGAGLGGTIMAYEMKEQLRSGDTLTVVTKDPKYHFVPSNPWVAVGWRSQEAVTVNLEPVLRKRDIGLHPQGAKRLHPAEKRIELLDVDFFRCRRKLLRVPTIRVDERGDVAAPHWVNIAFRLQGAKREVTGYQAGGVDLRQFGLENGLR